MFRARSCTFKRGMATSVNSRSLLKYPLGKKLEGYTINRVKEVPEFNLIAVDLTHNQTASRHLHIDRQDSNNVFGIVFKTNPPNSTGLPHILEHTTLCGSEKYPVRDPFFKMLNRSLSNFMNAMTGHDYTFYPFATTNTKDFDNLMNIYLDATLHPLLTSEDFYQEGWRLEHEETKNKDSPLTFKGVVYNEMKGQVSDSSYYFWIKFQEAIYPSLNNSGGDPQMITNLSHEDLVEFHSKFYHPSNSATYTYGNIPLETHLKKLNSSFQMFGKRSIKSVIKEPIKLKENQIFETNGPIDPMVPIDAQYKTSLTWYAGRPGDIYETFLLKIVSTLLMDGHSSPLYQKLIESGIGTDFSINSGADPMSAVNLFTIGLNGLTEQKSDDLQNVILDILKEVNEIGFPDQKIKAIIHQLELGKKVESAKFGLNILSSVVPGWVNDVDPIDTLNWNDIVLRFNEEYLVSGDQILKDVLVKYILNKPYFKYVMKPDEKLAESIQKEEKDRLESKISKLDSTDKEIIYERGIQLLDKQEEIEDLSCLPTVNVSDINRESPIVRINHKISGDGVNFQTRLSPKTNGLTYLRASKAITVNDLDPDLIKYLPLFSNALTNLGTKNRSMAELEDEIKLYTGGLSANFMTHGSPMNPNNSFLKMNFSGVSLNSNFEKMVSLWKELLLETNFNNVSKLSTLIKSMTSDNLSDIVSSGHSYARTNATSKISNVGLIQEKIGGIENIQFLSELAKLEANGQLESEVIPKLEKIRACLLVNGSGFKYGLTTSKEQAESHENELLKFNESLGLSQYELHPYEIQNVNNLNNPVKDFIRIPSQVSFSSMALNGAGYTEKDASSLQVLSQLMTFNYLHGEIREKGGAYGGGASFDALNGLFSFYSYRDPKPFNSIEVFNKSSEVIIERISSGQITETDLEQAKLTIFQRLDAPVSVREEGLSEFHFNIDDEMKQERRENLLDCTLDDVTQVSEVYLRGAVEKSETIIGHEKKEGWPERDL